MNEDIPDAVSRSRTRGLSEDVRLSWFQRLRGGLGRSSAALKDSIAGIFTKRRLDGETLEELEEALIAADLGVDTATALTARLSKDRFGKEVSDLEVRESLAGYIAEILRPVALPLPDRRDRKPQVILVAGVNGVGKTTTIGKLASSLQGQGRRVMLAACDTFRAAAVEQLVVWGQRNDSPVVSGKAGADAAGVAFEAFRRAREVYMDVLIIDTAGRLHNKAALMDELSKIVRVLKKLDPEAPHDTLLVLDATTGQNAHRQVEIFRDMVQISGLVVTKLDGTAKGGVVVALAKTFGLPVHAVGVGETIEDLRPFEAEGFARALLALP